MRLRYVAKNRKDRGNEGKTSKNYEKSLYSYAVRCLLNLDKIIIKQSVYTVNSVKMNKMCQNNALRLLYC